MFHSQRRQMSVRYEIAMHARQREKFAQQFGVPDKNTLTKAVQ